MPVTFPWRDSGTRCGFFTDGVEHLERVEREVVERLAHALEAERAEREKAQAQAEKEAERRD